MSKKGGKQRAGNEGSRKAKVTADPDPGYTWACSWNCLQSNKDGFFRSNFAILQTESDYYRI